mmetsp:Transcript_29526/g.95196  ORF Transcript_29526/g.95196 Transcript_29526/m.95196 type:complete len:225 (+) Transcript_29526:473-1147(+)
MVRGRRPRGRRRRSGDEEGEPLLRGQRAGQAPESTEEGLLLRALPSMDGDPRRQELHDEAFARSTVPRDAIAQRRGGSKSPRTHPKRPRTRQPQGRLRRGHQPLGPLDLPLLRPLRPTQMPPAGNPQRSRRPTNNVGPPQQKGSTALHLRRTKRLPRRRRHRRPPLRRRRRQGRPRMAPIRPTRLTLRHLPTLPRPLRRLIKRRHLCRSSRIYMYLPPAARTSP